jgi:hypothetical protein
VRLLAHHLLDRHLGVEALGCCRRRERAGPERAGDEPLVVLERVAEREAVLTREIALLPNVLGRRQVDVPSLDAGDAS